MAKADPKRAFLYLLPGVTQASAAICADHGLSEVVGDGPLSQRPGVGGPEGTQGVLLWRRIESVPRYDSEKQEWLQNGECWVGMDRAAPPKPEDLIRDQPIAGHWVRLGDGNDWLIPVARRVGGGTALEQAFRKVGDEWQLEILPKYKWLWEQAGKVFDAYLSALKGDGMVSVEDPLELAVKVLTVNYRIRAPEISLLGLLTTGNLWQGVLGALIDWPEIEARLEQEKKEPPPAPE